MGYVAYYKQKYHKKWDKSPVYFYKKDAREFLKVAMSKHDVHGKPFTPSYMQGHIKKVKEKGFKYSWQKKRK